MKKYIFILIALLSSAAFAETGYVVNGEGQCSRNGDYILIKTDSGYVAAEVFNGWFMKGDDVSGNLSRYGFVDVLVNGSPGRLWIDDYWLSKNRAREKCFN